MLRILGQAKKLCDGVSRRELMQVGALSLFSGMTWPRLLRGADNAVSRRLPVSRSSARSVILFNLLGGPSQMDMFDMKPLAPPEVRGEFQPIDTSLPGLSICEHLPNTARWMHKACVIRTVTHNYNAHNPLGEMGRSPRVNAKAGREHWPQCGFSLLAGGGIKAGMVYGTTDNHAAYPTSHPVSPGDVVATIYQALGIDPHLTVPDRAGRPIAIAHGGEPIADVIA